MTGFASLTDKLFTGAKAYSTTIGNSLAVILVFSGELLVKDGIFYCPCYPDVDLQPVYNLSVDPMPNTTRLYYGASFIVWPALALFLLASALSMEAQRCLASTKHHCRPSHMLKATIYYCQNSATSIISPGAWLIFVFIDGRYYECIVSRLPSQCVPEDASSVPLPTSNPKVTSAAISSNLEALRQENLHHTAVSQIIAWTSLGVGITLATLVIMCSRCFNRTTYYQSKYMETLREKELQAFAKVTESMLMKQMEDKWKVFFDRAELGDWEAIADLPTGSPKQRVKKFYYSAFDEWEARDEDDPEKAAQTDIREVNNKKDGFGKGKNSGKVGTLEMKDMNGATTSPLDSKLSSSQQNLVTSESAPASESGRSFENPAYSSSDKAETLPSDRAALPKIEVTNS